MASPYQPLDAMSGMTDWSILDVSYCNSTIDHASNEPLTLNMNSNGTFINSQELVTPNYITSYIMCD